MKMRAAYNEGMLTILLDRDNGPDDIAASMTVDFAKAWAALPAADRTALVADMVMDSDLFDAVLKRLANRSDSWAGDDDMTREKWLVEIGEAHATDVANERRRRAEADAAAGALVDRVYRVADEVANHLRRGAASDCCANAVNALRSTARPGVVEAVPAHEPVKA